MALLRIPSAYKPGLIAAAGLSEEEVKQIAKVFRRSASPTNTEELAKAIAPLLTSRSEAQARSLGVALFSLYALLATEDTSSDKLAHDVALALVEEGESGVVPEGTGRLEQNLRGLLASETFRVHVKAVQLQYDHERTYCDAKIYTDIRPIFADDPKEAAHTSRLNPHAQINLPRRHRCAQGSLFYAR